MPRANALINKATLIHICTQIGVTPTFLSQRTHISEVIIKRWLTIDDAAIPTISQAKTLAKILKVPFAGLYMSKEHIIFKNLHNLRNLRTMPDGVAIDDSALNLAIVDLIRAHDFLKDSEADLGLTSIPLSLPAIAGTATAIEFAQSIRGFFELELEAQFKSGSARQFYLYLRRLIEEKGIFIHCFTGVDVEAVRGIAIFDDISPVIGINDKDRYPAKTFSIIHELVHILKRQSTLCNDMYSSFTAQSEEVFCNAVAGEVLVPAASLDAYLEAYKLASISLDDIATISERFSVSKEVVTRRLLDTNHFTKDEYDVFTNEIRQSFIQEREAAKIARTDNGGQGVPRNMSREAVDKNSASICRVMLIGYGEGYFNKQDLSGLLGIKEKHISKFIAEVARW